ncbi:SPOSA6832_03511 [Sporobolomyces salmonicolor]|uniref:SPOSA6832_03511-mRNA-1:cds n=1 Tax=Sporidiobolus salmonicolor TaxID=5005 RepID=A0A0D6EPH5_SPOSA|nr:SPOSA6832_03511 [Sporobolomyces salmonicolor]
MTTIPSRLARLTSSSGSWPVAQARARSLYRQWYRGAPEIVQIYALNVPAHAIRAKVREMFDRNAQVTDVEAVDILLLKGYQEYQETINCWKMDRSVFVSLHAAQIYLKIDPGVGNSHVMRFFAAEELPARPATFLDAFYASRDDAGEVQPTA